MIGYVIKDTYRIDSFLGEGGPSVVYQGTDLLLDVPVAIKRLKVQASMGDGSSMAERFLREARTHARLNHQHIVGIRAVLEENDEYFIVMEYVDGGDLAHLLRDSPDRRLSVGDAVSIFGQSLLGLDHAHRNRVIHRDLKPSNILISDDQCAKIADFGLARAFSDPKITGTGFLVGTLTYMSPEQLQGDEAETRSDIYSLGISLYESLAGKHPFVRNGEKPTPQEVFGRHMFKTPPPLCEVRDDVSEFLSGVVERSMAKDPVDRYPDCIAFAEDLHKAVKDSSIPESGGHVSLAFAMQSGSSRLGRRSSSQEGKPSPATGALETRDDGPLRPPAASSPLPFGLDAPAKGGTKELPTRDGDFYRPPLQTPSKTPRLGTQDLPTHDDTVFDRRSPVPRTWNPKDALAVADTDALDSMEIPSSSKLFLAGEMERPHAPDTWTDSPSPLPRELSVTSNSEQSMRWVFGSLFLVALLVAGYFFWIDKKERSRSQDAGVLAQSDGGSSDLPSLLAITPVPMSPERRTPGTSRQPKVPDVTRPLVRTFPSSCKHFQGHMAKIPGGFFTRGYRSKGGYSARLLTKDAPPQKIYVSSLCMDRYEVTVGEYKQCIDKGHCLSIPWPPKWKGRRWRGKTITEVVPANYPMRFVNWEDATAYCKWAGKRLPTEAEWEWVARTDESWLYPWGNQKSNCRRAVSRGCSRSPLPVDQKRKIGSGPFGVFDMAGNVAEWVRDCYDKKAYTLPKTNNPLVDSFPCRRRVVRGGSFKHDTMRIRSYVRIQMHPYRNLAWIGFRCAASVGRK